MRLLDVHVFKPQAFKDREVSNSDLTPLKEKFIASLRRRGSTSISDLAGKFRSANRSGVQATALNLAEFRKAYRDLGLTDLTDDELRRLLNSFDTNGDGMISSEEFLTALRGPLNQRRNKLAYTAFRSLDKQGTNEVPMEDFITAYDAAYHPDVLSGALSEREVISSLLSSFGKEKNISSTINRDEFFEFIGNISVFVDDDDLFDHRVIEWRDLVTLSVASLDPQIIEMGPINL